MRAQYKNPVIHKAFNVLETLSADEKSRYLAEIREKALRILGNLTSLMVL